MMATDISDFLVAIRFLCSLLCIFPIILFTKARTIFIPTFKQNFWIYALLSLIGIIGYNGFVFEGVKYTSSVNAALIMATNPPLTMFFAAFLLQEKMNGSQKHTRLDYYRSRPNSSDSE